MGYRDHRRRRGAIEEQKATRFGALRGFARGLVWTGYVGVALGAIALMWGLWAVVENDGSVGEVVVAVAGAGIWSLVALLVVSAGQLVRCMLAIERNTRGEPAEVSH